MIFGRDELKLSGDTLEFDLPMSKLILFVQGSGVGDVTLTGSEGKQAQRCQPIRPLLWHPWRRARLCGSLCGGYEPAGRGGHL